MPNICTGTLRVRGYAPNVDELIAILQGDYNYMSCLNNIDATQGAPYVSHPPHFFRVFKAEVIKKQWLHGLIKYAEIDLEVAWSIWVCMFPGPLTYFNDFQKSYGNNSFGSHIIRESQRLQLDIEIWSYEYGLEFQEHYRLNSGILSRNENFEYHAVDISEMTYDEFREDLGSKFPTVKSEHQFKQLVEAFPIITTEMQEETWDFDDESDPKYLGNLVMIKNKE